MVIQMLPNAVKYLGGKYKFRGMHHCEHVYIFIVIDIKKVELKYSARMVQVAFWNIFFKFHGHEMVFNIIFAMKVFHSLM